MDKDNFRNTALFIVCALALTVAYQFLVVGPAQKRQQLAQQQAAQVQAAAPGVNGPVAPLPVADALQRSERVKIDTPALTGSIALTGARFDDLELKDYHQTVDPSSPPVEILRPAGSEYAYLVYSGWNADNVAGMPDFNTDWRLTSGDVLTPSTPITLSHQTETGLIFTRQISVDDQFMFTITDTVANGGAAPVTLTPSATVQRLGVPPPPAKARPAVEGRVGVLGKPKEYRLTVRRYRKWDKEDPKEITGIDSVGGWLGIADKYWLTALIPDQSETIKASYTSQLRGDTRQYTSGYQGQAITVAPGSQTTLTHHLYVGAKRAPVLVDYGKKLGIPRFVDAIDWGWDFLITKPIFWMIKWFQGFVGNFGLAILMMTVVVKLAFFFPANVSFASMTKMKKIQPQVDALRSRYKDDPAAQQQAMMKLYRDEKINPLMGCLPMLVTIPVFLGLYSVLSTTIEMWHAPFFGWINDLSAQDPTTILNLFGLIPWEPASTPLIGGILGGPLHLGVFPLLYGLTMFLTQSMSPTTGDPTQQMIFRWMPVVFTFILATLPVGLLIYYCWSNLLTIIQQYVIMRRYKVDNPIDAVVRRLTGKPKPTG